VDPPAGMTIDSQGVIHWVPGPVQAQSLYLVTVVVTSYSPLDLLNPRLSVTNQFTVVVEPMILTIRRTATNALALSWPAPAPGWILQQADAPGQDGNWSNFTNAINRVGDQYEASFPDAVKQFFRLCHP
jgi:hypothetical protein